jgi:hypothetical protein
MTCFIRGAADQPSDETLRIFLADYHLRMQGPLARRDAGPRRKSLGSAPRMEEISSRRLPTTFADHVPSFVPLP